MDSCFRRNDNEKPTPDGLNFAGMTLVQKLVCILVCMMICVWCGADTFTNRQTGETFYGYATNKTQGNKTLVCVGEEHTPKHIELSRYSIETNYLGRRNEVVVIPLKDEIVLESETKAIEKALEASANHGPMFILIEIDTPGGEASLTKQLCTAITKIDYCPTAAFVCGGKYGGAYSAGAMIALACKYIYMANGTAIGAATGIMFTDSGIKDYKALFGETVGEKFMSADRAYMATLAEKRGRPGLLAKAMVDKDIEVVEVNEDGNSLFVAPENRKRTQTVKHVWSKKGSLLTLTADEAVECGMADRLANSREEVLAEMGVSGPRVVDTPEIAKARREFERIKDKLDKEINTIDLYKKKLDSTVEHANFLIEEYNDLVRGDGQEKRDGKSYDQNTRRLNEAISKDMTAASGYLERIISSYKKALALKKYHPDLEIDEEACEEIINSCKVALQKIRSMQ